MSRRDPLGLLGDRRPSFWTGIVAGPSGVALTTLIVYPLKEIAPVDALGVVYLVAVLLVSIVWGGVLGSRHGARRARWRSTSSTSRRPAASRSPTAQNWVALGVFLVVAIVASSLAEAARRARAARPTQRRREADLAAEMARLLLRGERPARRRCPPPPQRLAAGARAAVGGDRARAPSRATSAASRSRCARARRQIGTLLVPADAARDRAAPRAGARRPGARGAARRGARARRAARRGRRDARAAAQRRPQDRAAARRLARPALAADRDPHRGASRSASADCRRRRARRARRAASARRRSGCRALVDNLLDLSRLEAGRRRAAAASGARVEEVLRGAIDDLAPPREHVRVSLDGDLPLVRADARSSSARSRTCSRTPPATRAGTRSRCARGRSGTRVARARRRPRRRASRRPSASGSSSRSTAPAREPIRPPRLRPRPRDRARASSRQRRARVGRVAARPGHDVRRRVPADARRRRRRCRVSAPRRACSSATTSRRSCARCRSSCARRASRRARPRPRAGGARRSPRCTRRTPRSSTSCCPTATAIEVCRALREWSDDADHRAVGGRRRGRRRSRALEAGADDYVTKPFGPRELVARLGADAAPRRRPTPSEPVLAPTGLELDLAAHVVRRDGEEVHLTPIEFDLLRDARAQPRPAA